MKKLLKSEKGFTLLELLIVVGILGILAAVLVPNLSRFFGTGTVAAANTEAASVVTAAQAYYSHNNGIWPDSSDELYIADDPNSYVSNQPKARYEFDDWGQITSAETLGPPDGWQNIVWDSTERQWVKE